MIDPIIFKSAQLAVLGAFIVFISDFRKKKNMVPLINEKWTSLMKATYLVPLAVYIYVLFSMSSISGLDFLAFGITSLGASLAVKAKRDLSVHHTWAGYRLTSASYTTNGIYAFIRHPIYTGIFLVVLGSLFTIMPRFQFSLFLALACAAISISYVLGFLAFLAKRETKTLLEQYGAPFQRYKEEVHPFLPLRKHTVKLQTDQIREY